MSAAYCVTTAITTPDGDQYTQHVRDFDSFGAALANYEGQTCSLRVIGHELVNCATSEVLERKGWLYGHDSGDFQFRKGRPRLKV